MKRPCGARLIVSGVSIFNHSPCYRTSKDGAVYIFNTRVHKCGVKSNRPCGRLYAPDDHVGWDIRIMPNMTPIASGPIRSASIGRLIFDFVTRHDYKPKRKIA